MSCVTQIIVTFPACGYDDKYNPIKSILKEFTDYCEVAEFQECHRVGGNKNLQCEFFIASFNYFEAEKFIEYIKKMKPVMIKDDNEDAWDRGQIMCIYDHDEYSHWRIYSPETITHKDIHW